MIRSQYFMSSIIFIFNMFSFPENSISPSWNTMLSKESKKLTKVSFSPSIYFFLFFFPSFLSFNFSPFFSFSFSASFFFPYHERKKKEKKFFFSPFDKKGNNNGRKDETERKVFFSLFRFLPFLFSSFCPILALYYLFTTIINCGIIVVLISWCKIYFGFRPTLQQI